MLNQGFVRVAAGVPGVTVADCDSNVNAIYGAVSGLWNRGAELVVLPELSVTGYTCGDLFGQTGLLDAAERGVASLCRCLAGVGCVTVVGAPVRFGHGLYNCAVVIGAGGRIAGIVPKVYLPTYGEFYEGRWFRSGAGVSGVVDFAGLREVPFGADILFDMRNPSGMLHTTFGVEICEDLWTPVPRSSVLALGGARVVLNLSASDDVVGKYDYLRDLVTGQSGRCVCGYVYASAGFGESSTDLVFDGKAFIAVNGRICRETRRWSGDAKSVVYDVDLTAIEHDRRCRGTFGDCAAASGVAMRRVTVTVGVEAAGADRGLQLDLTRLPFVPSDGKLLNERASEIVSIQVAGLAQRLSATHCRSLVIGVSGGLDSTLALLVAADAFDRLGLDREGIVGVTMPGFGTSGRTHGNARELMSLLGITQREIPIGDAVMRHFSDIGHDPGIRDVTYENCQARERTQVLMDLSNQLGGMVLGTGDMSELALGWATYNGDHMSMYGVNVGVPKTLVRYLVGYFADRAGGRLCDVLRDIIDTPISPELLPADDRGDIAQKTEDLVGPYELHDFFLYHFLRYGRDRESIYMLACRAFDGRYGHDTIRHWLDVFMRRFFAQQFKRSCMPDGPKVGSVCLSPRGDWRMPSDASSRGWM